MKRFGTYYGGDNWAAQKFGFFEIRFRNNTLVDLCCSWKVSKPDFAGGVFFVLQTEKSTLHNQIYKCRHLFDDKTIWRVAIYKTTRGGCGHSCQLFSGLKKQRFLPMQCSHFNEPISPDFIKPLRGNPWVSVPGQTFILPPWGWKMSRNGGKWVSCLFNRCTVRQIREHVAGYFSFAFVHDCCSHADTLSDLSLHRQHEGRLGRI